MKSIDKVKARMSRDIRADLERMNLNDTTVSTEKLAKSTRVHYSVNSIDDFIEKIKFVERKHQILTKSGPTFVGYKILFDDFYEEIRFVFE